LQEDGDGDGGLTGADGSIRLPNNDNDPDPTTSRPSTVRNYCCKQTPVWIASAGCNADCEELKRQVRSDLRAARYFETTTTMSMMPFISSHSVATLLSQILYQRRGFPYYSFCVVAGGDAKVFVYDAIGSYEQVAVATAGTGRELLQPILDRNFISSSLQAAADTFEESSAVEAESSSSSSSSLRLQQQRRHVTQVSCSRQEAVEILREAYEAVSEREIGVGDQLVMVVAQQQPDGRYECQVLTFPLKKH
jgi:20S proteasome subunit beta 6